MNKPVSVEVRMTDDAGNVVAFALVDGPGYPLVVDFEWERPPCETTWNQPRFAAWRTFEPGPVTFVALSARGVAVKPITRTSGVEPSQPALAPSAPPPDGGS